MTNVGNAIFSEPQINGDDVEDSCLASWGIRCSFSGEGHLRGAAIIAYKSSSDEDIAERKHSASM